MHAAVRQIGIGVCLIVALVVTAYVCFQSWADGELAHSAQVMEIEPGASLGSIAQQLVELGVVSQPKLFKFLASVESLDTQLKAGEYALKTPISPRQLLEKFSSGEVLLHPVRLREGITGLVMLQELKEIPHLQHTLGDFTSNNQVHAELAPKLGLSSASAEGYFFPDTYFVRRGLKDVDLLRRAHQVMQSKIAQVWAMRSASSNSQRFSITSAEQLLILASIIEKETGIDADRAQISQVFHKRLKRNMRLQTDPTVIYAAGESFDGDIRYKDLRLDSPYNTYRYKGLPPTPIALSSYRSLLAAVQPAEGEFLYFVARGDGSSQFSETLAQHNAAVRRYQLGQ
jgi:UPF0755 protein